MIKKIDDYFYSKPKKDFIYMLLAIALGIGFIFFYFIYPQVSAFEEKYEKEFKKVSKDLKQEKFQLNVKRLKSIRLSNESKMLKKELGELSKKKELYKELISLLDFAKFNQEKWSNFVKDIIFEANKNMDVISIENSLDLNSTSLISKKLEIGINLKGNYKDFVNFIYHYEDLKELLRVSDIDVNSSSNFYVKFVLYGYER